MISAAGHMLNPSGLDLTVEFGSIIVALLLLASVLGSSYLTAHPAGRYEAKVHAHSDCYSYLIWDRLDEKWLLDLDSAWMEFDTFEHAKSHAELLNSGWLTHA